MLISWDEPMLAAHFQKQGCSSPSIPSKSAHPISLDPSSLPAWGSITCHHHRFCLSSGPSRIPSRGCTPSRRPIHDCTSKMTANFNLEYICHVYLCTVGGQGPFTRHLLLPIVHRCYNGTRALLPHFHHIHEHATGPYHADHFFHRSTFSATSLRAP